MGAVVLTSHKVSHFVRSVEVEQAWGPGPSLPRAEMALGHPSLVEFIAEKKCLPSSKLDIRKVCKVWPGRMFPPEAWVFRGRCEKVEGLAIRMNQRDDLDTRESQRWRLVPN